MTHHVLRSWNPPDPFAPACGCELAPCGFVIPDETCDQHGMKAGRTMRNVHAAEACPGRPEDREAQPEG